MDIGIKAEVKGLIAKGYSRGEAIDRVAISHEVQGLRLVRTKTSFKKVQAFNGLATAFRVKALPL